MESQGAVFCGSEHVVIDDRSAQEIGHHLILLQEAGLISASFTHTIDGRVFAAGVRLTWDGHEFLDASRNATIWSNAKSSVLKLGGTVAFELLKEILVGESRRLLALAS